jgi:hypothetical protein
VPIHRPTPEIPPSRGCQFPSHVAPRSRFRWRLTAVLLRLLSRFHCFKSGPSFFEQFRPGLHKSSSGFADFHKRDPRWNYGVCTQLLLHSFLSEIARHCRDGRLGGCHRRFERFAVLPVAVIGLSTILKSYHVRAYALQTFNVVSRGILVLGRTRPLIALSPFFGAGELPSPRLLVLLRRVNS